MTDRLFRSGRDDIVGFWALAPAVVIPLWRHAATFQCAGVGKSACRRAVLSGREEVPHKTSFIGAYSPQ
jgi:hypothetical protein